MIKLSDVLKKELVFSESKIINSKDILGQGIKIVAWKELDGETGTYAIILAERRDGMRISFSNGGKVVMEKLHRLATTLNIGQDNTGTFKLIEPIEASLTEETNKQGQRYYNII